MKKSIFLGLILLFWGAISMPLNALSQSSLSPTVTISSPTHNESFPIGTNGVAQMPITVATTDFLIGTFDAGDGHWHLIVDGVDTGPHYTESTTYPLEIGTHTLTASLQTPDHASLDITDSVTVTVTPAPTSVDMSDFGESSPNFAWLLVFAILFLAVRWRIKLHR
jgi:hypothetical protein